MRKTARNASAAGGGEAVASPLKSALGGAIGSMDTLPADMAAQLGLARKLRAYRERFGQPPG